MYIVTSIFRQIMFIMYYIGLISFICLLTIITGDTYYYVYKETQIGDNVHSGISPDIYKYYTDITPYGVIKQSEKIVEIEVKAHRDACILLSNSEDLKSPDFYEICFGQLGRMIVLRRGYNLGYVIDLATHNERNLLNKINYNTLWIFWDGQTICPGIGYPINKSLSYFFVKDYSPPDEIRGIGIMTSYGAEGVWRFPLRVNPTGYFCSVQKTRAKMMVLGFRTYKQRTFCTLECQQHISCLGFNFKVNGRNNCELIYGSQPVVKEVSDTWQFYSKCLVVKNMCEGCRL